MVHASRTAICAAIFFALVGCGRSDLDKCVDSQVAAWRIDHDRDVRSAENFDPNDKTTVDIGGVAVPRNLLGASTPIVDEKHAEAAARLTCGKVYGTNEGQIQ
jgi:hypothetical protein